MSETEILIVHIGKPLRNIRCGKASLNFFYLESDLGLNDIPLPILLIEKPVRNVLRKN